MWAKGTRPLPGRIRPVLVLCLLVSHLGCDGGARRRVRDMQARRSVAISVVQRFDEAVLSIDALCRAQPASGRVQADGCVVEYPDGLDTLAREVADVVHGMTGFVEREFGLRWSCTTRVRLVRVDSPPSRVLSQTTLIRSGVFNAHLFVPPEETLQGIYQANLIFPASFAHELTELSLAFPATGGNPVLLDYATEGLRQTNLTRWFRDGLACYIGERVSEEYCGRTALTRLHPRPFSALHQLGELIFDWVESDYSISDEFVTSHAALYRACLGLFCVVESCHGREGIRDLITALSRDRVLDREGLFRAWQDALGEHPRQTCQRGIPSWLGVTGEALTRATAKSRGEPFQPGVLVLDVVPGSPAEQAGLSSGDILLRIDECTAGTPDEVERALYRTGRASCILRVMRRGVCRELQGKLRPRPKEAPIESVFVARGYPPCA